MHWFVDTKIYHVFCCFAGKEILYQVPLTDVLAIERVSYDSFKRSNMLQIIQPERILYVQVCWSWWKLVLICFWGPFFNNMFILFRLITVLKKKNGWIYWPKCVYRMTNIWPSIIRQRSSRGRGFGKNSFLETAFCFRRRIVENNLLNTFIFCPCAAANRVMRIA